MQKCIFNKMPQFVYISVIGTLNFAIFLGWNNRLHSSLYSHFDYFVRIISTIRQKRFSAQSVN